MPGYDLGETDLARQIQIQNSEKGLGSSRMRSPTETDDKTPKTALAASQGAGSGSLLVAQGVLREFSESAQ
jgi:hypothetical protein